MATPRRRYHVDVYVDDADGQPHALIRHHPGALAWVWCRHSARATSNAQAMQKAIAAHLAQCQQFEAEKRAYLAQCQPPLYPGAH